MLRFMSLNTRLALIAILLCIVRTSYADAGIEKILRKAIKENGYASPSEIYFNPDEKLASEGEVFFKTKHLSLNGKVSCSTCHITKHGSTDGIPNAAGVRGKGEGLDRLLSGARIVPRNTLGLWGVGSKGFRTFFWDGRVDFSQENVLSQFGSNIPSQDPLVTAVHLPVVEIRETIEEDDFVLAHKNESVDGADAVYEAITTNLIKNERVACANLAKKLNKKIETLTFLDIAKSIAAFIRKEFRIKSTKLDAFMTGNITLTLNELNGARLFYGKGGCISCHSGPQFTDQNFYTIPFPQLGFGKNGFGIDYGRYNATFNPKDLYKFRTPSLYNSVKTSPYSHSGSLRSLNDAIKVHYDPLGVVDISKYNDLERHEFYKYIASSDAVNKVGLLTEKETNFIIEFLRTLSFD
jgi:cytochrome c peroxidase